MTGRSMRAGLSGAKVKSNYCCSTKTCPPDVLFPPPDPAVLSCFLGCKHHRLWMDTIHTLCISTLVFPVVGVLIAGIGGFTVVSIVFGAVLFVFPSGSSAPLCRSGEYRRGVHLLYDVCSRIPI